MILYLTALLAQIPGPEIDLDSTAKALSEAIESGNWPFIVGPAVMILTWVAQLIYPKISGDSTFLGIKLPYLVAIIIATVGWFGVAMLANPAAWAMAIWAGVKAGIAAGGAYATVPKPIKNGMKALVDKRRK